MPTKLLSDETSDDKLLTKGTYKYLVCAILLLAISLLALTVGVAEVAGSLSGGHVRPNLMDALRIFVLFVASVVSFLGFLATSLVVILDVLVLIIDKLIERIERERAEEKRMSPEAPFLN